MYDCDLRFTSLEENMPFVSCVLGVIGPRPLLKRLQMRMLAERVV